MITVKTEESTQLGPVAVKARNPLPVKTAMSILGMIDGPCRPPLGRVTKKALESILQSLRSVWTSNPEFLEPVEGSFDVSVADRLQLPKYWEGLAYGGY
jgi:4-hydroxy-tetrahydrodipicolinate synthase